MPEHRFGDSKSAITPSFSGRTATMFEGSAEHSLRLVTHASTCCAGLHCQPPKVAQHDA